MKLSEFNFVLPKELIAYRPKERGKSRLLDARLGQEGTYIDRGFEEIINLVGANDVVVLNETKVIPSELHGLVGATPIRINLVEELNNRNGTIIWSAFAKPGKRLKEGATITFKGCKFYAVVQKKIPDSGEIHLEFFQTMNLLKELDIVGNMPLPPYIKRPSDNSDKEAYQTVFAKNPGSVAAPTAGLHFNEEILQKLRNKGVKIAKITLHVGRGTFEPVKVENIEHHKMHKEWFSIDKSSAFAINKAIKSQNGRVICIGTTTMRTLESVAGLSEDGLICETEGNTSIFIKPGYKFKVVDMLLTNFHLPKSTLFILICAILGANNAQNLYEYAISKEYRFFSYGDCCLLEMKKK